MSEPQNDLLLCLESLRCENVHHRWFIPERHLRRELTIDAVQIELSAAGIQSYRVEELAEHILHQGLKIFSVLVLIRQVSAILAFVEAPHFHDSQLPFGPKILEGLLPVGAVQRFHERQWEVIAPIFHRGTIHKSLHKRTILPFMKDEKIGQGAFGTVFEIEIMQHHQNLEKAFQGRLVRKELDCSKAHRIELENLSRLSRLKHPNIIELLASYSHEEKQNLLFPLAEYGSLKDLLTLGRHETAFVADATMLIAVAGLASAIDHVHDFIEEKMDIQAIGCHYDLRPVNVLVSADTFYLADFGLSRFKEITEDSATIFKAGGGNYRAPECEDIDNSPFTKHNIRRSSDIWSFGCILAELITYMVHGPNGITDFKEKRKFKAIATQYLFHCGLNKPNQGVEDWLSKLELGSTKVTRLVYQLITQMLSMDLNNRPKAKEVTGRLRLIAVCELIFSMLDLVDTLRTEASSDAHFEYVRFQSWQYALGIHEQQDPSELAKEAEEWHISRFRAVLDILHRMRALLEVPIRQQQSEATPTFHRIAELNDNLYAFLGTRLQETYKSFVNTYMLQDEDEDVAQETQNGADSALVPTAVKVRASLKYMTKIAMEHWERASGQRQIDVDSIELLSSFGDHHIASLRVNDMTHSVLVEWRRLEEHSVDESVNRELLVRVEAIAELLGMEKPDEFRSLNCRGFFFERTQKMAFGIVYDFPRDIFQDEIFQSPVSLHSLLEQTHKSTRHHPALEDKFRVAAILSRSVLEFHQVSWLHKRLSSLNVAFFPTSTVLQDEWFRSPYIIGFSHSRPDETSAYTGGPQGSVSDSYQHPVYRDDQGRYCQEFDYYSLGLILLEVGLWVPLHNMVQKFDGTYEQIRQHIIQRRLPLLKQSMGSDYHEAVRICLQGDFYKSGLDRHEATSAFPLHLEFSGRVVQRLKDLVGGFGRYQ